MRDIEAGYGGREKLEQLMAAAPDNLERLRQDVVDGMRTQRFVERLTMDLPPVPREEVEHFYRANPEQFRTPEVIHARHIVKNAVDAKPSPEPATAPFMRSLSMSRRYPGSYPDINCLTPP